MKRALWLLSLGNYDDPDTLGYCGRGFYRPSIPAALCLCTTRLLWHSFLLSLTSPVVSELTRRGHSTIHEIGLGIPSTDMQRAPCTVPICWVSNALLHINFARIQSMYKSFIQQQPTASCECCQLHSGLQHCTDRLLCLVLYRSVLKAFQLVWWWTRNTLSNYLPDRLHNWILSCFEQ